MNVPKFLIEMLNSQYGEEIANQIIKGYSKERVVTFRVNTLKASIDEIEKILHECKIKYERVPWSKEAFIIKNAREHEIQKLDIYQNGKIYLQSLSSMLPPIILEPRENEDILDMTAAPGGKTTQLANLSKNKANITACELNTVRVERLKYNVKKQGATCVYIMQKDSRNIDDFFSFDKILLDAPCSGSGTLSEKTLENDKYFTKKLIEKSTKSQLTLLKKAIKILKSGGEIVYSTCSILSNENEEVIRKALIGTNAKVIPIKFQGIEELPMLPTSIQGTLNICPNELYEGFFVAKIKKD